MVLDIHNLNFVKKEFTFFENKAFFPGQLYVKETKEFQVSGD